MEANLRGNAAEGYEIMLADRQRTLSFRDAIRSCVRRGDVVADIGCGSGILSLFAAEAGAARVVAVERSAASAALIRDIVADNGYQSVIEVVEADAATLELGERFDVVVSELIGNFGPEEAIEPALGRFCARHLKPGGTAIPHSLATYLVPVSLDGESVGLWWEDSYGFDLSAGSRHRGWGGARYLSPVRPWSELAPKARIEHLRFGADGAIRTGDRSARFELPDPARLEAFLGWFEADLCRGIKLTNRIRTAETSWPLWCWPVIPGLELEAGQRLCARVLDMEQPTNAMAWRLDWRADGPD